jgi:protein-S-isoprenylcysteine O-methyltransferase Ste14
MVGAMMGQTIFFVLIGIWVLMDFYLVLFYNHRQNGSLEEKYSKYWMIFFICTGMLSGIFLSESAKQAWLEPFSWFRYLSVLFLLGGIFLRWLAVRQLGTMFHSNVGTVKHHRLVTQGVYALVRHPSYLGLLLNFVGVAIAFSHPISSGTAVLIPLLGILLRIQIEEKVLKERFQAQYSEYMKTSKKLIPWIY